MISRGIVIRPETRRLLAHHFCANAARCRGAGSLLTRRTAEGVPVIMLWPAGCSG
jgi:hypothetical protein